MTSSKGSRTGKEEAWVPLGPGSHQDLDEVRCGAYVFNFNTQEAEGGVSL